MKTYQKDMSGLKKCVGNLIYEGEVDAGTWMYYEQAGIVIMLANWLNGRMQIEAIEKLECV